MRVLRLDDVVPVEVAPRSLKTHFLFSLFRTRTVLSPVVREVDDKLYAAVYRAGAWSEPQMIYGGQRGYLNSEKPVIAASGVGVVQWEFAPWADENPDWSQYSIWANVLR